MTNASNVSLSGPAALSQPIVAVRRTTIDTILSLFGVVVVIVLAAAGGLLSWGASFAHDYVLDELGSQNVYFGDAASLKAEGRADLVKYASEKVTNGTQAEAYASYIAGHLTKVANGKTYADLGGPERTAKAAVTTAQTSGASTTAISALQAKADEITNQRNTLFKGETLRGLLLTAFAWSTVGRIAGIAAIVAFAAAAATAILVLLGFWHLRSLRARTA